MLKRVVTCLLFLLLTRVGSALAQDAGQPLLLIRAGDVWDWTGGPALRQKTQWGYNMMMALSPSNKEIAYLSYPQIVIDVLKIQGGFGGGLLPSNVWVISTDASDTAYRVADQPANASFAAPGRPDTALIRYGTLWSPDGTKIAWSERSEQVDAATQTIRPPRLQVYDAATKTVSTLIESLPVTEGEGAGLDGTWTDSGLVIYTYSAEGITYTVYDDISGTQKFAYTATSITTDSDQLQPRDSFPVRFQGKTWIMIFYVGERGTTQWHLLNLDTGETQISPRGPMGVSATTPTTSLQVYPKAIGYAVYTPNGTEAMLTSDPQKAVLHFALSPDGQAIAYQLYNPATYEMDSTIYVWRGGSITTVPNTEYPARIDGFVWGSTAWMIPGEG